MPQHDITQDDLDAIAPSTVCDRCGDEVPLEWTSAGLEDWPDWAGATLCSDCWAEAEAEAMEARPCGYGLTQRR